MIKKINNLFFKNLHTFGLIFLITTTISISFYFNYQKKIEAQKYDNFLNNIYLKKTLKEIINKLEPRYKIYMMLKCVRQILVTLTVHTSLLKF